MMIGRAVGWMEWSGLVKGRVGDGDGALAVVSAE